MALLWWAGGRRCGSLWPVVLRPISFAAALCIMVQASRFCKTTPRASRCYGPRPPLSVPLPRVVTGDELGDDGCCLRLRYGLARHGRCRFRTSHLTITLTPKRFGYLLVIAKMILLGRISDGVMVRRVKSGRTGSAESPVLARRGSDIGSQDLWVLQRGLRLSIRNGTAVVEHVDAVGEIADHLHVMLDPETCDLVAARLLCLSLSSLGWTTRKT